LITAIVIGLCLGFLPHNFYPAQIFMGDSGAMFLGLMISASAITLTGQVDASTITAENSGNALLPLLLPFTILAIPLLDFAMAIIRRLRAGRSPFSADREHIHHRIMRMGLTQQRTTVVLYLWTAMFAIPTAIAAFIPIWFALLAGVLIFAVSVVVIKQSKHNMVTAKK
jgi:UDP-GlcNAc:undecaprenyl-phosphate GlcNAc-1-phosphate transferase